MSSLKVVLITCAASVAVAAPLGLSVGYSVGVSRYTELRGELDAFKLKTHTVTETVREIVYKDRTEYKDKIKIVDRDVPFIVERPVYKNICLDADGIAAFNTYMGN